MGTTKDNLTPKSDKTKGWFDGVKNLTRSKKKDVKKVAKTYIELLKDLEDQLEILAKDKKNRGVLVLDPAVETVLKALEDTQHDMLVAKKRDVQHEPERTYNLKVLAELEIQQTFIQAMFDFPSVDVQTIYLQALIESAARCATYGEDEEKN